MNAILNEIKSIMEQSKEQYLPQVKSSDLEENGAVYFMNSKNGTEFIRISETAFEVDKKNKAIFLTKR